MPRIRVWESGGFNLSMWDTGKIDWRGSPTIRYELRDSIFNDRKIIFQGEDFNPSPMYDPASDESVNDLLGFLSLMKDDMDSEHFKDYTMLQMAWRDARAEDLKIEASCLEAKAN